MGGIDLSQSAQGNWDRNAWHRVAAIAEHPLYVRNLSVPPEPMKIDGLHGSNPDARRASAPFWLHSHVVNSHIKEKEQ